jgi:hypothetical protein
MRAVWDGVGAAKAIRSLPEAAEFWGYFDPSKLQTYGVE